MSHFQRKAEHFHNVFQMCFISFWKCYLLNLRPLFQWPFVSSPSSVESLVTSVKPTHYPVSFLHMFLWPHSVLSRVFNGYPAGYSNWRDKYKVDENIYVLQGNQNQKAFSPRKKWSYHFCLPLILGSIKPRRKG